MLERKALHSQILAQSNDKRMSPIDRACKNFKGLLQLTWHYFSVLAKLRKKTSYNDGGNANGAGSCLHPLWGLADEV